MLKPFQTGFSSLSVKRSDGRLYCWFLRPTQLSYYTYENDQQKDLQFNLGDTKYKLFVATGPVFRSESHNSIQRVTSKLPAKLSSFPSSVKNPQPVIPVASDSDAANKHNQLPAISREMINFSTDKGTFEMTTVPLYIKIHGVWTFVTLPGSTLGRPRICIITVGLLTP